jgi:hypothetical protein
VRPEDVVAQKVSDPFSLTTKNYKKLINYLELPPDCCSKR